MTTPALRVAMTLGALRVPPTYFAFSHAAHLRDVDFRYFAAFADLRAPVPWPVTTAPGGGRGPVAVRRALGGATWPLLGRSVARFRPHVVHQQFGTWSTVAVRAAERLGVPLVVSLHGYDVPAAAAAERGSRGVLTAAARYLAASRHLAGEAIRLGFPAERVDVVYVGVDTEFFSPLDAAQRRAAHAAGRICLVGRLSPEKGVDHLLRAIASMPPEERPSVDVVGDGPDRGTLTELAERLRLDVTFHGLADRAGVRDRIRSAAVVVLPALEHQGRRETAGLVLLEAQACGVPVVAYDSGGTAEMVAPGRPGSLVPEADEPGLGAALGDVLALDTDAALRLGDDSIAFVRADRSEPAGAARLRATYAELTEGAR